MAILTIHHWSDFQKGLRETRRVTRARSSFSHSTLVSTFWLLDYLPELAALDKHQMPSIADLEASIGLLQRITVPVPHGLTKLSTICGPKKG